MKFIVKLLPIILCIFFWSTPACAAELKGFCSDWEWIVGQNYEKGSRTRYAYYVSPGAPKEDCALYVILEFNLKHIGMIERLFLEGCMPEGLVVFATSGELLPTIADTMATARKMRPEEFDQYGAEFSNFIVEEIVPTAARAAGVRITDDPDRHFVAGCSSGGLLAWNALWFRNDYFHRGNLTSPTFSAIRGGEEAMVTVRKTEPRPIRVFITCGTNEPDYFFGDSFYAACNAADALSFAGYDVKFEMYPNSGHGAGRFVYDVWKRCLTWMFSCDKVTAPRRSSRFLSIVPEDSAWEEVSRVNAPSHLKLKNAGASYSVKQGKLKLKHCKVDPDVAWDLENVTAIAFSSDMWRLYVSDKSRRFIYAYTLDSLGNPVSQYKLAPLHLAHDCRNIGGMDICVTNDDRVFVATELGVQSICTYGFTDLILPLPGDVPALKVWLDENWLYAASAEGNTFRRKVNSFAHDGKTVSRCSSQKYGDGVNYSRKHLESTFKKYGKGTVLHEN